MANLNEKDLLEKLKEISKLTKDPKYEYDFDFKKEVNIKLGAIKTLISEIKQKETVDPWEEIDKVVEQAFKFSEEKYNKWKKEVEKYDLINIFQQIEQLDDLLRFIKKREGLVQELFSLYWGEERYAELIIHFFSSYFEINLYELDFQLIPYLLDSKKRLVSICKDANVKKGQSPEIIREWGTRRLTNNPDIKNLFKKFEKFSYDSMKKEYLTTISKGVKEFVFDVSVKDLYDLLLNFDKVIPLKGVDQLTEDLIPILYKMLLFIIYIVTSTDYLGFNKFYNL